MHIHDNNTRFLKSGYCTICGVTQKEQPVRDAESMPEVVNRPIEEDNVYNKLMKEV
jgi:hypothetical protein